MFYARTIARIGGEVKAIEASNLRKTYPGDVVALDGLSFTVEAGTIFGLLGPNGAGKSTTVKILTTLSRPDSGEARVAGLDVVRNPERVRRSIGVVGQKHGLDPESTGRENLEMQAEIYGLTGSGRRERVEQLLERFGLAEAAGRIAKTYSGGMQRRLDVALGLVHRVGFANSSPLFALGLAWLGSALLLSWSRRAACSGRSRISAYGTCSRSSGCWRSRVARRRSRSWCCAMNSRCSVGKLGSRS